MGKHSAIVAMTAHGPAHILAEGGSKAWVLNPKNAARHKFVVLVQTRKKGNWGGATEPHGTAFLIGKVSAITKVCEPTFEGRYKIGISEYARINVEYKWRGSNPIRYAELEDEFGIDPDTLDFLPVSESGTAPDPAPADMPPRAPEEKPGPESGIVKGLTIPMAKASLAAHLGVSIDDIEIIIRA